VEARAYPVFYCCWRRGDRGSALLVENEGRAETTEKRTSAAKSRLVNSGEAPLRTLDCMTTGQGSGGAGEQGEEMAAGAGEHEKVPGEMGVTHPFVHEK